MERATDVLGDNAKLLRLRSGGTRSLATTLSASPAASFRGRVKPALSRLIPTKMGFRVTWGFETPVPKSLRKPDSRSRRPALAKKTIAYSRTSRGARKIVASRIRVIEKPSKYCPKRACFLWPQMATSRSAPPRQRPDRIRPRMFSKGQGTSCFRTSAKTKRNTDCRHGGSFHPPLVSTHASNVRTHPLNQNKTMGILPETLHIELHR